MAVKRILSLVLSVSLIFCSDIHAQTFNVFTPGTLEKIIDDYMEDAEELTIKNLKVSGFVNGDDLVYIKSGGGYVNLLENLDLSEAEIVSDSTFYYHKPPRPMMDNGDEIYIFFDHSNHVENEYHYENMYGYTTFRYFVDDLRYMFNEMYNLKSIKLPKNISNIGERAFENCSSLEKISSETEVRNVGFQSFNMCEKLQTPDFLSNLETVGNSAFMHCKAISGDIVFKNMTDLGDYAFYNTNLQSIDFSTCELKSIKSSCFSDNSELYKVILSEGLETIGNRAFYSCSKLKDINFPSTIIQVGYSVFDGTKVQFNYNGNFGMIGSVLCSYIGPTDLTELIIPEGVKSISPSVFNLGYYGSDWLNLESLVLPQGIILLDGDSYSGNGNFNFFTNLKSINLPNSLKTIKGSFIGCSCLESVILPDSLIELDGAFRSCTGLTQITIPETLQNWRNNPFADCSSIVRVNYNAVNAKTEVPLTSVSSNLKQIRIGDKVEHIPNNFLCDFKGITSITFPQSLRTIGSYAFSGCNNLEKIKIQNTQYNEGEIVLPDNLGSIDKDAFSYCSQLKSKIIFPNSLKLIGSCAFEGCSGITEIVLGDSLKIIESNAFCNSPLYEITSHNLIPPSIDYTTFLTDILPTCLVKVHSVSLEKYKNDLYWKDFKNIVGIEVQEDIPGDVTGDGEIDINDVVTIVAMILDGDASNPLGDLNGDGEVDVLDIVTLVGIILDK